MKEFISVDDYYSVKRFDVFNDKLKYTFKNIYKVLNEPNDFMTFYLETSYNNYIRFDIVKKYTRYNVYLDCSFYCSLIHVQSLIDEIIKIAYLNNNAIILETYGCLGTPRKSLFGLPLQISDKWLRKEVLKNE